MSYRLLDPLARHRDFRLLEGIGDTIKRVASPSTAGGGEFAKDLIKGGEAKSGLGKLLGWDKKTKFIDRVQDTVDIVGIVDPTGVADGANALTYAARGKWGQAGVSALGMIPYLGDVGKIGKYGARGAKAAGKVEKAAAKVAARKAATKGAEKVAEKGLGHAALGAARKSKFVRGLEVGAKRKMGRYGRSALKMLSGEGKLRGKVGKVARRVQDFRQTGAGQKIEKSVRDKVSDTFSHQAEPQASAAQEPAQQPQPDAHRAPPAPGPVPADQRAPSPQPQRQEAPREQPQTRGATTTDAPRKPSGGGGRTKIAGRPLVPVDGSCPKGETKTSTWGAPDGMKRCHKQTPGRWH